MGAPELLALSLGLSIAVAALGGIGGRLFEGLSADPRLRERVWAAALILPALPPLTVGLLLLTPASVREVPVAVAGPTPAFILAPAEVAATALPPTFSFDPVLMAWAVLAIAALLCAGRLAALALRARTLARIVRKAQAAGPAVTAMVESAARELGIRAPRVGVSAATTDALLASLGRARLILPVGLIGGADPVAAAAVIAHELAHLKRGDHRALWLEEALLALLAVNPLMPLLRARRAAAREEACDALALGNAAPETRRAYARSLIDALRDRAGPQASGDLPALTFTGAGRNTVMHRLKAVLNPVGPAKRAVRLAALGLGLGLVVAAAGASVAIAGQRAETVRQIPPAAPSGTDFAARLPTASAADYQLFCAAAEGTMDRMGCSMLLWDAALAEETAPAPAFCAPNRSNAELELIADRGRAAVLTRAPGRGSAKTAARRAMIAAFPCRGEPRAIPAAAVARAADTLGAAWEQQHGDRSRDETAARRVADAATTGTDYQRMCASQDARDDGFCAGILFRTAIPEAGSASPAFCAPGQQDRAATARFVEGAKAGVAQVRVSAGQTPEDVARAGLVRAYPCAVPSAAVLPARGGGEPVFLPVSLDLGGGAPVLAAGEHLFVTMLDESRTVVAVSITTATERRPTPRVEVGLTEREFPPLNGANRVYTLTGEIRTADGAVRYRAEPATIRLAPGSRGTARNLSSSLSFRPV